MEMLSCVAVSDIWKQIGVHGLSVSLKLFYKRLENIAFIKNIVQLGPYNCEKVLVFHV